MLQVDHGYPVDYRVMTMDDYPGAFRLWESCEGLGLSSADTREAIDGYLRRNPGSSFVADRGGEVIGTVVAGHDGRRGYIYHLAVAPDSRGRGIGSKLVRLALDELSGTGIRKCHIMVLSENANGRAFWEAERWTHRPDICLYSADLG